MSDLKDIRGLSTVDKRLPEAEQPPTEELLEIEGGDLDEVAGASDGSATGYGRY